MKKSFVLFVIFAVSILSSFATTKTVGKSGAQFTSIQKAIDSFTETELTDGAADVVEIIDNAEYDEQVVIGGLIADPDGTGQTAGYLDAAIELAKKRDAFTLRGKDSNNRPKINPITEGVPYGVFTGDPGDNFVATFSYMGKDITVENVAILQSSIIAEEQYGINGQAGNTTFKNVLFAHAGDTQPGEALLNFNNDVAIAGVGFDNSYTFIGCTFDAAVNGERNSAVDTIYFHGYSQGDADAAGVAVDDIPVNVTFQDCKFLNSDTVSMIRGNAQANNVTVKNCYITENNHGFRASGKGTFVIQDSIFYNNMQNGGDSDNDLGAVETVGRGGFTPALTVKNSLFVDNLSADFASLKGIPGLDFRAAAIRTQNDGVNPDMTIENCTFVNNPVAIRFTDASARARKAIVNKNIFQNCNSSIVTADDANDSYFKSVAVDTPVESLVVDGSGNIFDGNFAVVESGNLLPNVKLLGTEAKVTFSKTTIDPADPFAGPPYVVTSGAPTGVGANLGGSTAVSNFMIFE